MQNKSRLTNLQEENKEGNRHTRQIEQKKVSVQETTREQNKTKETQKKKTKTRINKQQKPHLKKKLVILKKKRSRPD